MASMHKTIINSAACVILPILGACENGETCTVSSEDELGALSPERCPTVKISDSDLVSLDGLDLSEHATHLQIVDNPVLSDVRGANGAIDVVLRNNPALRVVDLDVRNGILARDDAFESVALVLDPVEVLPGEPFRPAVDLNPSPAALNLSCVATCELDLFLADVDQMAIVVDASVTLRLFVTESVEDWTALQGTGVPSAVRFSGTQDRGILQQYRDWLDSQGFTGSFVLCNANDECEEIAPT